MESLRRQLLIIVLILIAEERYAQAEETCQDYSGQCQNTNNACDDGNGRYYCHELCPQEPDDLCCFSAEIDQECSVVNGVCQHDVIPCAYPYISGQCGGPYDRRCCPQGPTCRDYDGTCQDPNDVCDGGKGNYYGDNLCPQGEMCCLPSALDQDCFSMNGVCQIISIPCEHQYISGQCGGPADRQCCRQATCVIKGDPHFITTDNHHYIYGGTCSYYLLYDFIYNITANFSACTKKQHVSCLQSITAECYGYIVTVDRNGNIYVLPSPDSVSLPFITPDGIVRIYEIPPYIIIECNYPIVKIKWSGRRADILFPFAFFNATKGLCGTYDNDPNNDFLTSSGIFVNNVDEFGDSWVVLDSC